jgi:exocyst complex component 2
MYKALIFLVEVHAQVCKIAEPLLDRMLRTLAEELAAEALRCFRQVRRFGMGGMLQVRISVLCEFVNACL